MRPGRPTSPSRRQFLTTSAAASGGLALGLHLPALAQQKATAAAVPEVNAWVMIKPDETVVIRIARSEMGQGTLTGLCQLVAEELECDWKKVTWEYPTPGQSLARKRVWGEFGTGGSRGIRTSEDYVRKGGAAARIMLVQAAAEQWKVPADECTVANGVITHAKSKKSTTYGKVASLAAKVAPPKPADIKLKDPKTWKIAGKPVKRLDTAEKLTGKLEYAIDVRLPGMLSAAIRHAPVYGSPLKSFDEAKIKDMPGVKKAMKVAGNAVAVVADTYWHAKKALDALPVVWDDAENKTQSSETIAARLKEGLTAADAYAETDVGDALKTIEAAQKKVEGVYATPFLAHACMEPMNCTAKYTADKCEVWVSSQNGEASLAAASEVSGLPLDKCEVYKRHLGGGFGRRGGSQDYVKEAVEIAKQFPGTPVKLVWTREQDISQDIFRPISMAKLAGAVDEKGDLVALHIRVSGQSINAYSNPAAIKDGKDRRQLQGLWKEPGDAQIGYTVPNLRIEYAMRNTHVPVGPWRGVNTNQNGVYLECFVDELAKLAGKDPLEFRRKLMGKHPKHLAVLNAVAEKAEWGKPLPAGVFRGIAQFMGYGSYSAAVAEVSVSNRGKVKVHRMVLGVDSGHIVNPEQVAMQVEGSVAMGLGAALYQEITVKDGAIVETNFDKLEMLKLEDFPKVETVIVPSGDFWGGIGEPTICVVSPAVMNAISAAVGKPVRTLPLKNEKLRA